MPLDTFTYYLLKVGFIPPLRAHSVLRKTALYQALAVFVEKYEDMESGV